MRYTLFIILSLLIITASAQKKYSTTKKKAIKEFELAQKNYHSGYYKDAKENLDLAIKADENFIEPYLLKAQIYFEVQDVKNEIAQYEKALEINRNYTPKVQYLLSIAYFNNEQYKASLDICKEAQQMETKSARLERLIVKGIEASEVALELYENPVPFNPINLGPNVNSPYDDYWPMLSTNGTRLYTTKNVPIRADVAFNRKNANEDFFINFLTKDSAWGPVRSIAPLNTRTNEGAPSISADGQTFVFTACNRKDGFGKCDIYIAKRQRNGWTRPQNIGAPINTRNLERQPSLSPDGKTIYFTSDRPGTDGLEDIWISHLENDKWSKPINLGDVINTEWDEEAPFVHPDGTRLYFASKGHNSMGGYDVFYSDYNSKTPKWSKPKNIGYPLNTVFDDLGIAYMPDGSAYIAGNHKGGMGGKDIYKVLFGADTNVMVVYTGQVIERQGSQKTPVTKPVSLTLLDNQKHPMPDKFKVNPKNHRYTLLLKPGSYTLVVKSEGYKTKNIRLRVTDVSKQTIITKEIVLEAEGQ